MVGRPKALTGHVAVEGLLATETDAAAGGSMEAQEVTKVAAPTVVAAVGLRQAA